MKSGIVAATWFKDGLELTSGWRVHYHQHAEIQRVDTTLVLEDVTKNSAGIYSCAAGECCIFVSKLSDFDEL